MRNIRNLTVLIGNIGDDPKVTNLESGKKVARFSLATNENYKNAQGDKVQSTEWHNIVVWGKTAEIVENFTRKGKEVAITGKLKTRSYTPDDGIERRITEVQADEILLLGKKSENDGAEGS